MSQETTGMNYLTMSDVVLDDKRVLVRVDFNSPMDDNGNILDDKKIKSHLPTLQSLEHSKVVLLSHQVDQEMKTIPPWKPMQSWQQSFWSRSNLRG